MAGKKLKKLIEKSVLAVHEDFNKLVSKVRGFPSKAKDKTHKRNHKGTMENAPAMTRIQSNMTNSANQKLLKHISEEVVDGWTTLDGSVSRETDKTISDNQKMVNNIIEEVVDGWTTLDGSVSRETEKTISDNQKMVNNIIEEVVDGWTTLDGSVSREPEKTISANQKMVNNTPEEVVDGWTTLDGSASRENDKKIIGNQRLFNNVSQDVEQRIHWTNSPENELTINNYQRMTQEPLTNTKGDRPGDRILVAMSKKEHEGEIIVYNKILGKGGFGTVHLGTIQTQNENDMSERLVAVKAINYHQYIRRLPQAVVNEWETHFRRLVDNELRAMLLCSGHANIIQLIFVTITDSEVQFGLEYASKGDLRNYIEKNGELPERQARKWCKDLAEAVVYCHNKGIVHLDIKVENVLVDNNDNVKLTDFGLALIATHPQDPGEYKFVGSRRGTPDCMAPEMLMMNVEDTRLCDAWNLGIVLFKMLTGFPCSFWSKDNRKNLFFQFIPAGAKTLVSGALDIDPSKRLSLPAMLSHPWLQGE